MIFQASGSSHSFAKSQGAFLRSSTSSTTAPPTQPDGTVLFDFTASSTFELTATAGTPVWLMEKDDGSGWMKVSDGRKDGLVPSSYLQMNTAAPTAKPPAVGAGGRTGKKGTREIELFFCLAITHCRVIIVRALYDYVAQGDDELSLNVDSIVTLTPKGDSYAEGWYEGRDSSGKQVR